MEQNKIAENLMLAGTSANKWSLYTVELKVICVSSLRKMQVGLPKVVWLLYPEDTSATNALHLYRHDKHWLGY